MKRRLLFILPLCFLVLFGCSKNKDNPDPKDPVDPTDPVEPVHTHTFSSEYVKDVTYHWHVCSECGEISDKESHNIKEEITKQPTCKEVGTRKKTCSVCGYSTTEEIEKLLEHTWDNGKITKEASETEDGIITYTCNVCGATKTETYKFTDQPVKISLPHSTFVVGQYLEYTDFVVEVREAGQYVRTNDFKFNLEGKALTLEDNQVKVTCGIFTQTLNIVVVDQANQVEDIEIITRPNYIFTNKSTTEDNILYRFKYKTGGYSDYFAMPRRFASIEVVGNVVRFNIAVVLGNETFTKVLEVDNAVKSKELVLPTKTIYAVNEVFDISGCKIKTNYYYGDSTYEEVTLDMVDVSSLHMDDTGVYTLKVTKDTLEFTFEVEVTNPVTGIALVKTLPNDISFTPQQSLKDVAAAFEDGALELDRGGVKTYINVKETMLSVESWDNGEQTITLTYLDKTLTFNVLVAYNGKTVSEIKKCADGTQATITGVVIGFKYYYTPSSNYSPSVETVVKDLEKSEWIIVKGLSKVTIGDIIEFSGTVSIGTDTEKQLKVTSSSQTIIDHTNDPSIIELDLSNAVTIYNNDQWKTTFNNDNRANTFDTVYKIHGNARPVLYQNNTFRICMPEVTGFASQYFTNRLSGVFRSEMIEANTSYTAEEFLGNNTSYISTVSFDKDLYVIFGGSMSEWYCDFIILGDYCIKDVDPIFKGYALQNVKSDYLLGEEIDNTGWEIHTQYIYGAEDDIEVIDSSNVIVPADFNKDAEGDYVFKTTYKDQEYSTVIHYRGEYIVSLDVVCEGCTTYESDKALLNFDLNTIKVKKVNSLGVESLIPVTQEMFAVKDGYEIDDNGSFIKTINITYNGVVIPFIVVVEKIDGLISISEAVKLASGATGPYIGVVVAHNYRGTEAQSASAKYPQTIVKDLKNNAYLVIDGTSSPKIGDIISFTAKKTVSTQTAGKNMPCFTGAVITTIKNTKSKNIIEFDLSEAIVISNEQMFKSYFDTEAERVASCGMLFKIENPEYFTYGSIYRVGTVNEDGTHLSAYNQTYFTSKLCPVLKAEAWSETCTCSMKEAFDADAIYLIVGVGYGEYYFDMICPGDYCIEGGAF